MPQVEQIDSDWAWSGYSPDASHPWNRTRAAHLFRRAGFAATSAELDEAVQLGPRAAIHDILKTSASAENFDRQSRTLASAAVATGNVRNLSAWWVHRMLTTPDQLIEKLTLFWHGHFATSAAKVDDIKLMLAQNQLLRTHAAGDFVALLQQISKDPAMLIYLDSVTNRKAHPNENYAREIMELFCLGEGNYSEQDIRELARCFTGWEIKREKFRFNRYQHDTGTKTILGQSGKFGGEEGVDIVASQNAAPLFIVGKLVRFLVSDSLPLSKELLNPLANLMRERDMQIEPVVRTILSSELFYSDHAIGRKIRSPVEFAVGFLRATEGSTNSYELADALDSLGQGLFYPPSVKGWDGGRTWINSSTLLGRSNLVNQILKSEKTRFARTTLTEFLSSHRAVQADGMIDWFESELFAVSVPEKARQQIRELFDSGSGDASQRMINAVHALCTLPEFQLG